MRSLDELGSEELVAKFREVGRTKTFQTGAEIFAEGDEAMFLPIVLSGKVKVIKYLTDGKEVIINIFQGGEIFAIPPVLDGKKYPATAIAMENTQLLLVYRNDFIKLLKNSEEFSSIAMKRMSELLRETTASIENLATASPEERVGNVLVRLAKKESGSGPVKIPLRRQDIAEMAGLTTETTIRAVRRLADKKLLKIVRGKVIIDETKSLLDFLDHHSH